MRRKKLKRIKEYVRERFPFLSPTPLYKQLPNGTVVLDERCERAAIQKIKRNERKVRRNK